MASKSYARRIRYLGYYSSAELDAQARTSSPAGQDKMRYIITALNELGYGVDVVSASQTRSTAGQPSLTLDLGDGNTLTAFRSAPYGGLTRRLVRLVSMRIALLSDLARTAWRGDTAVVYHSLGYASVIAIAQMLTGFRLILEVEELYADISKRRLDHWRERIVFGRAHGFILPTAELNAVVNRRRRPCAIAHGVYAPVIADGCPATDGRIHVVYAGTLDARKGGAQAAVRAASHLDPRYRMHIIGFGSVTEIAELERLVQEVNESSRCQVSYDGLLSGADYSHFLQSCHIGLSTHRMEDAFNDTSYPSKILSYMRHGLRVVSARIRVVESSAVAGLISFYNDDTPEAIAEAITDVDVTDSHDPRQVLSELHREFVRSLGCLLGE